MKQTTYFVHVIGWTHYSVARIASSHTQHSATITENGVNIFGGNIYATAPYNAKAMCHVCNDGRKNEYMSTDAELITIIEAYHAEKYPPLRGIKVTYANGDEISTNMAAHLTDAEMLDYFKIGKTFSGTQVVNAEILC